MCIRDSPQGYCMPMDAMGSGGGDGEEDRFESKIREMEEHLSIA